MIGESFRILEHLAAWRGPETIDHTERSSMVSGDKMRKYVGLMCTGHLPFPVLQGLLY